MDLTNLLGLGEDGRLGMPKYSCLPGTECCIAYAAILFCSVVYLFSAVSAPLHVMYIGALFSGSTDELLIRVLLASSMSHRTGYFCGWKFLWFHDLMYFVTILRIKFPHRGRIVWHLYSMKLNFIFADGPDRENP